ncbi:MAG: cytochrome-c oxidase, cbb3-type subunit III [Gammaproteobacteria bacterium]|nr:cytochrome-c oxidase, cbb3-type subunit III [Gammaproteobacteria bacterium]
MHDFVSEFWSWYIIIPTILGLVGCVVLLLKNTGGKTDPDKKVETMGHIWDEDLEELNNPLPLWWLFMFYFTIVFAVIYLVLYPGLGSFEGILGWSQVNAYEKEKVVAGEKYDPIFDKYINQNLIAVAGNPEAITIGKRLFSAYCTQCHGSDAGGARGYPSLRDDDWLFGGKPEDIKKSILEGRVGAMPAWEEVLDTKEIFNVAEYVRSLSGHEGDSTVISRGKESFVKNCVVCHGADAGGNYQFGAPNLTNNIWLYGGSQNRVIESISKGRNGQMPPHKEFLGEAKAHLLAAYVYSLTQKE